MPKIGVLVAKKLTAFLFVSVFAAMSITAMAWACTPSSSITVAIQAAPPQTIVGVVGRAGPETVELRWNSPKGQLLATAQGLDNQDFSTQVEIPDVPPGIYYLMLTTKSNQTAFSRAAIEVTASPEATEQTVRAPASVSAGLWDGFSAGTPGELRIETDSSSNLSPGLAAGALLAATGLGTLAIGGVVAAKRRRASHA